MVELMIAIMILGLGLVMVATIFPVGLDMTRATVEKSITIDAVETAIATVMLKVPTAHDEIINVSRGSPWANPQSAQVVLLPTPLVLPSDPKLDLFAGWFGSASSVVDFGMENDANVVAAPELSLAYTSITDPTRLPYTDLANDASTPPNPLPAFHTTFTDPQERLDIVKRSRAFTEVSFWDENFGFTYVLPGQNVPIDFQNRFSDRNPARPILVTEQPPTFGLTNGLSRLHLSEHVYPPIRIDLLAEYVGLTRHYDDTRTPTRWTTERDLAQTAADRRYSWSVIYVKRGQPRTLVVTVVVLNRGELNAQFAYQRDQRTGPQPRGPYVIGGFPQYPGYDGGANDPTDSVFLPQPVTDVERNAAPPESDRQDGLFPRPWLVALGLPPNVSPPASWKVLPDSSSSITFYSVDSQGQALCTAHVARLIPSGSTVVFADTGKPFRVLSSIWDRSQLSQTRAEDQEPARLRFEGGTPAYKLLPSPPVVPYVWVYPPPVLSHDAPTEFDARSPVIAALQREVTLP